MASSVTHTPGILTSYVVGIRNGVLEDHAASEYQNGNGMASENEAETETRAELANLMPRKDHGYAWVILSASILGRIIMGNGQAIMGLLILELNTSFHASTAELVAISTTQFGIAFTTTFISSLCLPYIGVRATILSGSLAITAGYVASCFASSTTMFFITYSVLIALGTSFSTFGFLFPLTQYFDKHRSLALGLFVSSLNIGNFIWPPIVNELFRFYGWRGSFLILAGIQLNMCVLGSLIRPFWIPKSMRDSSIDTEHDGASNGRVCSKLKQLLTDGHFMLLNLIMLTGFNCYSFGPAYLPTLAEGIGATDTEGALLVSIQGITTAVSGLLHGFLSDRRWFRENKLIFLIYSFVMSGVMKMFFMESTAYWQLVLFALLDGISLGGYNAPAIGIAVDMVAPDQQGLAIGINSAAIGWGILLGNLSSGWLFGHFGSLFLPAIILGSVQILAALLATLLYFLGKRTRKYASECNVTVTSM